MAFPGHLLRRQFAAFPHANSRQAIVHWALSTPTAVLPRFKSTSFSGRPPRNEEIEAPWLQLVNPHHESNPDQPSLIEPARTSDILSRIDLSKFTLHIVNPNADPPVAKITPKDELAAAEKAKVKAARQAARTGTHGSLSKEVSLSWATTFNDLSHKLKAAKKAIAEGGKATIIIAVPPGRHGESSRRKTAAEKKALILAVTKSMEEANGQLVGQAIEGAGAGVTKATQEWKLKKGTEDATASH